MDKYMRMNIRDKLGGIRGWVYNGATPKDIYERLGVSKADFYLWKRKYPEFAAAVSANPEVINGAIIDTAMLTATGYYIEEDEAFKIKTFQDFDGDLKAVEKVEVVKLRKYIAPSSSMNMFMLKSRLGFPDNGERTDSEIFVKMDPQLEEWSM